MALLLLTLLGLLTTIGLTKIEDTGLRKGKRILLGLLAVGAAAAILWSLDLSVTARPINFLAADLGVVAGLKVGDWEGPGRHLRGSRAQYLAGGGRRLFRHDQIQGLLVAIWS